MVKSLSNVKIRENEQSRTPRDTRREADGHMSTPRSSRERYRGFVEAFKQRRLDEPEAGKLDPAPEAPRAGPTKRREYLRDYMRWLWPHRYAIGLFFGLALLAAALEMVEPLFMRFIIDRVLLNTALDMAARVTRLHGRHEATDAEVEDAARRANAHEFIVRLPEQYETFIGERGVKLSGGQCQRLAIARAILASPQILILDEATSNLDTESEQLIQASMASLLADRTTFVIAHRLSTIRRADLILLMEDGRVIERGTHDELMTARGTYYRMVLRQMESAMDDGAALWR
jgi:ABC-type bacteriocin/lantibiotic exporter with double-glycine peptidase domain